MPKYRSGGYKGPAPGSDAWKVWRYLDTHTGVEQMLDQAAGFKEAGYPAEAQRLVETAAVLSDWLADRRSHSRIIPSDWYAGIWTNGAGARLELRSDGSGRYADTELLEWSAQGQRVAITGYFSDNYGERARMVLAFLHRGADDTLAGPFLWAPDVEKMIGTGLIEPLSRLSGT